MSAETMNTNTVALPVEDIDRAVQDQIDQGKLKNKRTKLPKKKKAPKDPADKRPLNPYFRFTKEFRSAVIDELTAQNGEKPDVGAVSTELGRRWKELNTPADDETDAQRDARLASIAVYHKQYEAEMAIWREKKGTTSTTTKKSTASNKPPLDEVPDAPEGWNGPNEMKYLLRKTIGIDGKPVKKLNSFADAIALANQINDAWSKAVNDNDVPSHWKSDVLPCGGITKTGTGYELRLGPDMLDTPEDKKNGGIASWTFNHVAPQVAPVADDTEHVSPVVDEHATPKTPDAPKKQKKKPGRKPKSQNEGDNDKPKKAKKVAIKKKSDPVPVNVDDCDEIEIKYEGKSRDLLVHRDTGFVYDPDNLLKHIGTAEGGELELF